MNIKIVKPLQNLSESQQQFPGVQLYGEFKDVEFEKVMITKSLQFNFDCGVFMAKIIVPLDNKFGLKWHFDNSTSVEEFIESVRSFISSTDNSLTDNDVNKLVKQYQLLAKKSNT
jgi:hypothetical protein